MDIPLDEVIYGDCVTTHPSTGAATDADSTPTFAVYEEATDTDIGVGGNMTKRTSLTGNYRYTFTLSAANGFEVGKWYSVIGSATVNSIAGKAVLRHFRVIAAEATAGYPVSTIKSGTGTGEISLSSGTVTLTDNSLTAAKIANDAITDAKVASDVTIASVTGSVGSVSGNVGGNVAGSVASVTAGVTLAANQDVRNVLGTLTTTERTAIANEVEAQIIDDTDSEKVLTAITDKIASVNPSLEDLTLAAIASAVRTELTTELGRIDVAVSTRASPAQVNTECDTALVDYGGPTNAQMEARTLASAAYATSANQTTILSKTNLIPASPAAVGSAMTLSSQERLDTADAILGRSVQTIEGTAAEHSLTTIILASLESSISGTTWTIKRTNGTTTHLTKTVAVDATADPITGVS